MIRFLNIKKVITVTDFENSSFFVLFFFKKKGYAGISARLVGSAG